MVTWREQLLEMVLFVVLTLAAGGASLILHGWMTHRRSRQPLTECVTAAACYLVAVTAFLACALLSQMDAVPWELLGRLTLLVTTAPPLLRWLGPPGEHVAACKLYRLGKGSAYSHFFGYLRLMQKDDGIRKRLNVFKGSNPPGLSERQLENFYSDAVVALAPTNGEYPDSLSDLRGVGPKLCALPSFTKSVGGNTRSYGGFGVHEVSSSEGRKRLVAIDKIGALATLRTQRQQSGALSGDQFQKEAKAMLDELERIIDNHGFLCEQVKLVRYDPRNDHVGDAILTAISSLD